jgi:transcription initiation factor TFIIIB Brf1 subunit/transcription initiation factor TFIIB
VEACPECHSAIIVNSVGESVCSSCGLVVDDTRMTADGVNNKYLLKGKGMFNELTSTLVPGSFIDMDSNKSLSISNVRALGAESTLLRGFELIRQVCRSLGLNKNLEKRAIFLLKTSLPEMRRRLRLTVSSAVGAVILFAVRESDTPISFKEIFLSIKNKGKRTTASTTIKAYRILEEIMGEAPKRMHPATFIVRIVNVLSNYINAAPLQKQEALSEIKQASDKCLSSLPNQVIAGKNPYVLAACVVYYVLFKQKKYSKFLDVLSTADYARIMHVTEYSLKMNSKIIERCSVIS